ncbi:phosphotransferase family protein [Planococcus rifietoensis]|uniref:phosphotransferase family protein n=1 Tax=Planococcus rifietoensis TaxID=200991 RepID=UPI00384D4596
MKDNLKKKVEEKVGKVNAIHKLAEQGGTSEVFRIETSQDSFLLKSSFKKKYRMWLAQEAKVLEKLDFEKRIPIPKYHGFIDEQDRSSLIMSFETGRTLTTALREASSVNEKNSLIKSFGQFLHNFHEKEPIIVLGQEGDWLKSQLAKAQSYVDHGQTAGSQELLNQLKNKKPSLVKQTMIHGDCTTDNVFVMDGEIKLFIDVAGMTIGDPRYDVSLAIRKFVDNPELLNAFYEGYTRYRVSKDEFQYFDEGLYEFF